MTDAQLRDFYRVGAGRRRGDHTAARTAFEESLGYLRELHERSEHAPEAGGELAVALERLGRSAFELGELDRAGALHQEVLELSRGAYERMPN